MQSPEQGLYKDAYERDSCGFGLIASLDDVASHWLVRTAMTSLNRLTHRGAIAADGKTGDGCGLLLKQPEAFLEREKWLLLVVVRQDVAPRKNFFQVLRELRINRHDIFEVTVLRAILHHQDLAVALDHLRLDLAGLIGVEDFERRLARSNSGSIGDAKDMRVDGDRRLAEGDVQNDIRRFPPDTREVFQRLVRWVARRPAGNWSTCRFTTP